MNRADDFIEKLKLEKHIEGGSFKQVYKSTHKMPMPGYGGERSLATAIYFLLAGEDFSAFHRLKSDEIWAFNYGSPLTLYVIEENGSLKKYILGDAKNPSYQITILAHQWFAAEVNDKTFFTLVSCIVAPGFEYDDFELADREKLTARYPKHADIISQFTR